MESEKRGRTQGKSQGSSRAWKQPKTFTFGDDDLDRLAKVGEAIGITNNDSLLVRTLIAQEHRRLTGAGTGKNAS